MSNTKQRYIIYDEYFKKRLFIVFNVIIHDKITDMVLIPAYNKAVAPMADR